MKKLRTVFIVIVSGAIGAGIGLVGMRFLHAYLPHVGWGQLLTLLVVAVVAYHLHLIVHEAGHLLAGKLSGYTFVSYRVGSLMITRENGKLVRKKYTVAGTAGQCLLSPPDMVDGKFPLFLYNAGGALMNFLLGALCFGLSLLTSGLFAVALFVGTAIGVFMGLFNIIPMKIGGMPNDGYNMLLLGRDKNTATRHAFWVMLRANAAQASGVRPREFPTEWFDWVDMDNLNDSLIVSAAILRYNYLLDKGDLTEARACLQFLLDNAKMIELLRNELLCELLFFELINECRPEEIERIYTKDLQAYIKATATYASRQRLLYAYHRLFTKDAEAAGRHLILFCKACETSASLGEIPGEQELIAVIDKATAP
ncbi:MAG: M50 family metallopeptidase [Oscillospiraceae bacterium]|nr:M50 family metallopeptidase [Oscillospiraceae bacterium]